jgi:hypothetical protein
MKLNEEIKKNNPFKVPDGYFESLTEKTMSAIRASEGDEVKREEKAVRRLNPRPYLALAAAIVGFAVMTTVMIRLVTDGKDQMKQGVSDEFYADLAVESIDTYLIENELNLTETYDLNTSSDTIPSEAIIDYLIMENIDLNDIYELF